MADIRPIQFETESLQMLSALGDIQEKREILERQRMQEEIKQKRELMDMIDPMTLSKNLESEVVNARMGQLKDGIASFIKNNPNHSSDELRYEIQKNLSDLAQWNAKVKTIKANIDDAFKAMPQDKTVNKSAWRSAAISKALYNPNTRSLKNIDELDDQYDFVSDVWNNRGDVLINMDEVGAELKKRIKDQPLVKMDVTVTKPVGKVKKTVQERIEIPSFATWDSVKNKIVLKTDKNGDLDQDVYTDFIGQPGSANDKFVSRKAKDLILSGNAGVKPEDVFNPDGSVKNEDAYLKAKKQWASGYLYNNSPITQIEKDITQPARVTVVTPGQEAAKSGLDWMNRMDKAIQSKDTNEVKGLIQSFYGGSGKSVQTSDVIGNKVVVSYQGPKDTRDLIKVGDKMVWNPNYGKSSTEKIEIDINDPNAIRKMAGLYQTVMGADKLVEGFVVNRKTKLP
jgi:hypothetical protein